MAVALQFERLVEEVARRTGLAWRVPEHVSTGLAILLEDVERAGLLTREGRRLLQHEVLRVMSQRIRLQAQIARADETLRGQVLVVTGAPRTSSTLLHNMLADAGQLRWLPFWKALEPAEVGTEDQPDVRSLERAATHISVLSALSPDLVRLHPMRADRPEECITLMQLTGVSDRFSISLTVPNYRAWTMDPEVVEASYRDYARILNVVFGPNERLLLKAPSHAPNIDALTGRLEQATVVWLRRDPDEVEASFGRLVCASRAVFQSSTSANDWLTSWRGLEPPEGALTVDHGEVLGLAKVAAVMASVQAPAVNDYADWLRPSPRLTS